MDADKVITWLIYWLVALVIVLVSGWFAKAGAAVRAEKSPRSIIKFLLAAMAGATVIVATFALVTDGRGCSKPAPCPCENDDWTCVDQYCR
jgi:hypothetical protein